MKSALKAPGIERLKLKYVKRLSRLAFNLNLRRYTADTTLWWVVGSLRSFQGTSNGGRQFLSNRRSNRHIVPLHGKSDRLFTRERKFAQR